MPSEMMDVATSALHLRGKGRSSRKEAAARPAGLSKVHGEAFGFRLCRELGRGTFARVFLAHQADLAERPVVLKVSAIEGDEPQTLAQLQHTHIVPIYSVHEDRQAGLRAVCMPYFGGAALSEVLRDMWGAHGAPKEGRQLVEALRARAARAQKVDEQGAPVGPSAVTCDALGAERPQTAGPGAAGPTALTTLDRLCYFRATAWVVARLAEAAHHAHQRGVLHRDIKPSNVLLSDDGQPMLLDFNVAHNLRRHGAEAISLGGTVAYMSPEHLRALGTPEPGLARRVDHRSDIYSLGMVMYEMLAGCRPFEQTGSYSPVPPVVTLMALERSGAAPSLRGKRPDAPWGLESILRKCLAPNPEDRYQQAEHLAEDLRRFLEDRPLRYAPELSVKERVRKWARRHPKLTSSASVAAAAAVLLAFAGLALAGVQQHLAATQDRLAQAEAEDRKEEFQRRTTRALCLVNTTSDVDDHLRRGKAACEEALALYGALDRDDWQSGEAWRRLEDGDRSRLAEDVRELLLMLAWARTRTAPGDKEELRRALALLERGDAIDGLGPSRALWEDRGRYLDQLGDGPGAREAWRRAGGVEPASARDYYLVATTYARAGRPHDAIAALDKALRRNPKHYWSLVQRGICFQELGQYTLAAGDFGACVGLWPEFAWGYFNRGYVFDRSGLKEKAVADYTAAIERDGEFVLAYLNRGLALLEQKRYPEALADFDRVGELGRHDATQSAGRGVALEGLGRHEEADTAFSLAFQRAATAAPEVRTRIRWVHGFAVSARLPQAARESFNQVLRALPNQPQALYGLGMLESQQGRDQEAIPYFNRVIEADPGLVEARRYRGVLLARLGQLDAASADINWCLEREPNGGAALYAAACVASLAAAGLERNPAEAKSAAAQAIHFLRKALAAGYGQDKARSDPDLRAIRKHPEFALALADGTAHLPRSN
jgi:serine/threonine protein kinase/lipoprotein NlpI